MNTATVSPEFGIVIPKPIRESFHIRPGQKLQIMRYGNRIELIPLRPIEDIRGFLRGIDTSIDREPDHL